MNIKQMFLIGFFLFTGMGFHGAYCDRPEQNKSVARLAEEVKNKGWIVYSASSENGTWDIFLSRPDGSLRRNITNTSGFEEAAPRLSRDGKKMLYRRLPKGTVLDHDRWGFQGRLVIAGPDGSNPEVIGEEGEYPWASWSPDSRNIICLTIKGIHVVELAARKVIRELPRQGIYQQLFSSPDGRWFCGVANTLGMWTIVRVNAETGRLNPVHKFQSCTPDWFPDSKRIIFSSRPADQSPDNDYGWTQLWMADGDGENERLVYGEDGFHIYGGILSPDGKYVLFTKSPKDGGGSKESGAVMCIIHFGDTPLIGGESRDLRKKHPGTNDGPVLELPMAWEPFWTYAEIGGAE